MHTSFLNSKVYQLLSFQYNKIISLHTKTQQIQMATLSHKMENFRKKNNLDIILEASTLNGKIQTQQNHQITSPQLEMMPIINENTLQHIQSTNLMHDQNKTNSLFHDENEDQNRRMSFNSNFSHNFYTQNNQQLSFGAQMRPYICEIKQQIIDVQNYCKQQIEKYHKFIKIQINKLIVGIKNRVSSILNQKNKELQAKIKLIQQLKFALTEKENMLEHKENEIKANQYNSSVLEQIKEQLNQKDAQNIYLKDMVLKYKQKCSNLTCSLYQTKSNSQQNLQKSIIHQEIKKNPSIVNQSINTKPKINQYISLVNLKSTNSISTTSKEPPNSARKIDRYNNYNPKSIEKQKVDNNSNNFDVSAAMQRLGKTYSPKTSNTNSKMIRINELKEKLQSLKTQILREG